MDTNPTKYWKVDERDIRITILRRFLGLISPSAFETDSSEEIVEACIKGLKNLNITSEEEIALRIAILKQNAIILDECLKNIREELAVLGSKKILVISLGCGDESVFERAVSEDMAKNFSEIELEWLGIDTADYRSPSSFLRDKAFKIIDSESLIVYRSLVETDKPIVLIGRYSYHHLGISFDEFLQRCGGISKVILIEEPASSDLWKLPDYRVMRIAYDILGNLIMSHSWASEFIKEPSKFEIQYLILEILPAQSKIVNFHNVLPETSLVSI